ncbi:MAG: hypothetical protein IJ048_09315 [Clostridia bacterium]|nr:hypothetical protein [Clostridia bacterium]
MKRIAAMMLAVMLAWSAGALAEYAAPSPTSIPGRNVTGEESYVVVAETDTEVRVGAGASFNKLGTIAQGTVLNYADEYAMDKHGAVWYKVQYGTGYGFVSEDCAHLEAGAYQGEAVAMSADSIGNYRGAYAVDTSSYRPAKLNSGINVSGACAMDGDLKTAWNSYEESLNQWFRISVVDGQRYQIAGFRIAAGYWKSGEVYYANCRPAAIDIYCDGMYVQRAVLEDKMDYQTVWFDTAVTGSSIEIVVKSLYMGRENHRIYADDDSIKDCCISEIELIGAWSGYPASAVLDDWGDSVRKAAQKVLYGGAIRTGDAGMEVVGLQLLLREGFYVLGGAVDGSFGSGTQQAVDLLASRMRQAMPGCEPMRPGVVDAAYWRNMLAYMDLTY